MCAHAVWGRLGGSQPLTLLTQGHPAVVPAQVVLQLPLLLPVALTQPTSTPDPASAAQDVTWQQWP